MQHLLSLSTLCIFVVFVCQHVSSECPAGLIQRLNGSTHICCHPAFNCPRGNGYKECSEDNAYDGCEPCPGGSINNHVSSFDNYKKYPCYNSTDEQRKCSIEDSVPISTIHNDYCSLHCDCDVTKCFYGNPCEVCGGPADECGIDEELNATTGVCEPCREFMYKKERGCGPCVWNETAWRLAYSQPVPRTTSKTVVTSSVSDVSSASESDRKSLTNRTDTGDGQGNSGNAGPPILIIVLIAVAVVIVLGLAGLIWKCKHADENSTLMVIYQRLRLKSPDSDQSEHSGILSGQSSSHVRPTQAVPPIVQDQGPDVDTHTEHPSDTTNVENGACSTETTMLKTV